MKKLEFVLVRIVDENHIDIFRYDMSAYDFKRTVDGIYIYKKSNNKFCMFLPTPNIKHSN